MISKKTVIILFLCAFGIVATLKAQDIADKTPKAKKAPTHNLNHEDMIKAIAIKNIFKPKLVDNTNKRPMINSYNIISGPEPLVRPFTLIGINIGEEKAMAQLLFSNPVDRKAATVDDVFETLTITEIHSTYIRCDYDGYDVKIDVGESSENARNRIMGFNKDFEFIGTTITDNEAFAYIKIGSETLRLEVGDALGDSEIIRIEEGKLWIRHANGLEFAIDPTSLNTSE